MKRILIPVDGSEYAMRAMAMGKELAEAFGSEIILLHVLNVTYPVVSGEAGIYMDQGMTFLQLHDQLMKNAGQMLAEAKEAFGSLADRVSTVVDEGEPAHVIIDYVEHNEIDLLVMGSRGMGSALQRIFVGSVANKVIHSVSKPVLVVK